MSLIGEVFFWILVGIARLFISIWFAFRKKKPENFLDGKGFNSKDKEV